ncbi:RNA-binding protein [Patescibacteria group bacterium]|nr:RNA-binding protein [Patescibacteria group bacterium]
MVKKELKCTSCKVKVGNMAGAVRFMCPSCGKKELIRCEHCRKVAAKYTCSSCSFSGPN